MMKLLVMIRPSFPCPSPAQCSYTWQPSVCWAVKLQVWSTCVGSFHATARPCGSTTHPQLLAQKCTFPWCSQVTIRKICQQTHLLVPSQLVTPLLTALPTLGSPASSVPPPQILSLLPNMAIGGRYTLNLHLAEDKEIHFCLCCHNPNSPACKKKIHQIQWPFLFHCIHTFFASVDHL